MTHRGPFQPLLFCDSVRGRSLQSTIAVAVLTEGPSLFQRRFEKQPGERGPARSGLWCRRSTLGTVNSARPVPGGRLEERKRVAGCSCLSGRGLKPVFL